ncbi:amylo-alpha-1,6-glucosidase [Allokutzneria sp. A3M-2-11 16]|uniref:glycogen debranching N-terminal domain-containing protein n=1 Tax=Allokutzneria sp. A3M-2-11 16 TaxID=2962043 RepID=UPI0020B841D0|nr:glycogen debranching N-terminal domain-containing protein [Allokutzneria sp. A3M-2-11 16]MCP3801095.1 amylo-alpha-1,6-glucosidase [Allokutzneria sp. A3M-2-11 16]
MADRVYLQPTLHELVTVLRAPSAVLGGSDGQLRADGAQGFYRDDRRVLSRLEIDVDGVAPTRVAHRTEEAERARFLGVLRGLGEPSADPKLHLRRERQLTDHALVERFELTNSGATAVTATVGLTAATDLAAITAVKSGAVPLPLTPTVSNCLAQWESDGCRVDLRLDGDPFLESTVDSVVVTWEVHIAPGATWRTELVVTPSEEGADGFLPRRPANPPRLAEFPSTDIRAARLAERGLADLDGLLLADPQQPGAAFLAAGSPWFFTLFGRDSLWAARLLLPNNTDLALGTLWALAARQGRRNDAVTEEQPGKILHEVRRGELKLPGLTLPPLYYGSVDSTALWVCLLHDVWRAERDVERIRPLLPHLVAALEWIAGPGDADGDGFCEYAGSDGAGLANQGWKDSSDGVRWGDGRIASRPLALCEVQGYAHAAALGGAELLDALGEPGGQRWRDWAAALRERFRAAFWVSDKFGRYPAIALDGEKRAVCGPSSNMGHLLGTGILSPAEAELVAEILVREDMSSGYGLRTLSADTAGYNPLSYHCGSVWPHDTAIAVFGLLAEGHEERARVLARGLLAAGEAFEYRLPELYGGDSAAEGDPVTAYPAACRPQAWSAAAGVAVAGFLAGQPHPMAQPWARSVLA